MEWLIILLVFALPFAVLTVIGLYGISGKNQKTYDPAKRGGTIIDPNRYAYYEVLARNMREGVIVLDKELNCAEELSALTLEYVIDFDIFMSVFFDSFEGISVSRDLFESVFKQSSAEASERILTYFPGSIRISDRMLGLRYSYDKDNRRVFIFLTDESDRNLKAQALNETIRIQDMVINVLKNRAEYSKLMDEMNSRTVQMLDRIYNDSVDVDEFKRLITTELVRIKNDLRLFNMKRSIENIETMEEAVQSLHNEMSIVEIRHALPAADWLTMTRGDREDMSGYLSESLLSGNSIVVNKEWLAQLELIIDSMPDTLHQKKIDEIVLKIKMTEIQEITRDFDRIIQKRAREVGKKVNPILLTYGFLTYDREFIQSIMMDVFALLDGSIEFGIEHPATRFRRDKAEHGTIHIDLRQEDENLVVEYSDDGVGVEIDRFSHICEDFKVREQGVVSGTFIPSVKSLSSVLQYLNHKIRSRSGTLSFESIHGRYIKFIARVPYRAYLERQAE